MKIAFIVGTFPSLSETFITNQITGLLDLGHDVWIFASKKNFDIKHPDIDKYHLLERVYYFNIPENKIRCLLKGIFLVLKNFYKHPAAILGSLNVIKFGKKALTLEILYSVISFLDKNFDIIHCHFGPNGITGVAINSLIKKTNLITTFHGNDLSGYLKLHGSKVYKYLFYKGDLFLPVSEFWKKKLIEIGCDSKRIRVHRMGVDVEKFKQPKKRKKDNNQYIRLLSVGRLVEKKGIEYGILAFSKVIKKYPHIRYNIVGEGPLRGKLELLIKDLNYKGKINITGSKNQDEIIDIMQNSDIFIAPSIISDNGDSEGIPIVIMEAMATCLPVVSTLHSAIPELVSAGISGFLVPEKDVKALADKINFLIENKQLRVNMGKNGREIIKREYNIKILNKTLVKIYKSLLI